MKANECSIGLWGLNLNFTLENDYINRRDEEKTKEIFEKARAKVGTHPNSWKIWKKYAEFEIMRDNKNITNLIYYSALCALIDDVDGLMADYTKFVETHFDKLKDYITSENPPEFKDEKPNLLNHFLEANNDKESFLTIINRLADKAREEKNRRAPFENALNTLSYAVDNITNPALKTEKDNWKNYIDMEKGVGNHQNAVMLYKRMLIPFFDDFSVWKDYIEFLSTHMNEPDKCREVYKYLRAHPISDNKDAVLEMYLSNAYFEEKQGQHKLARKIYNLINKVLCPNYIKAISEYIKFEQRIGGPKKNILEFLEDSLEKAIKNEDEFATIFLTVNTCRFHFANEQDLDLVFDIFSDSVKSFRHSKPLFLNFVKLLETITSAENKLFSRSFEIIEKATLDPKCEFELVDKKLIATSYLNWLKNHCKEQTYIDLVQNKFVQSDLVDGGSNQNTGASAVADYNNGTPQVEDTNQQPASTDEIAHSGDKRTTEEQVNHNNEDESHKRQKTEE